MLLPASMLALSAGMAMYGCEDPAEVSEEELMVETIDELEGAEPGAGALPPAIRERLAPDAAAARLGGDALAIAPAELEAALSRGAPHDLTGIFLVLAALALLAETVFANLPRRRLGAAAKASLASQGATAA